MSARKLDNFLQNKQTGFSLIELLLVIILLASLTVSILKNLKKQSPTIHDYVSEINTITQKAFYLSLLENKIYQVRFYFEGEKLVYYGYGSLKNRQEAKKNDIELVLKKKPLFDIKVKNFFINNKDELANGGKEIWILFFPEGFSQMVHFTLKNKNQEIDYTMNPFSGFIEEAESKKNEIL